MPRSKPRFNDLKDRMIRIMSAGGDPTTDRDPEIAKFSKWYLEPGNRLPRAEASVRKTGGIKTVALYPFAIPASEDAIFLSTISQRTVEWLGTATAVRTAANYITNLATAQKGKKVGGFYPAQAIFRETSTITDKETSKITGRKYTRKSAAADKGYVVPFGTNATGEEEMSEVQADLIAAKPANMSLAFKPEEYTPPGSVPAFAA
jgi:hypothetical protein